MIVCTTHHVFPSIMFALVYPLFRVHALSWLMKNGNKNPKAGQEWEQSGSPARVRRLKEKEKNVVGITRRFFCKLSVNFLFTN